MNKERWPESVRTFSLLGYDPTMTALTGVRAEISNEPFKYDLSLVSYLDVLGMRDLLNDAGSEADQVARVLQTAQRFSKPDRGALETFGYTFTNFSDLILRTVPILRDANRRTGVVFNELLDLAHIQVNLINRGVPIRGALTVGDVKVERGLVFGPALANAYLLESQQAVYPRIIVDPAVLSSLTRPLMRAHTYKQEWEYIRRLVKKDSDRIWFIDYLEYARDNADDNLQYAEFLHGHRCVVAKQIFDSGALDGRTREGRSRRRKAWWLRNYHNKHVRSISVKLLKQETGVRRCELFFEDSG